MQTTSASIQLMLTKQPLQTLCTYPRHWFLNLNPLSSSSCTEHWWFLPGCSLRPLECSPLDITRIRIQVLSHVGLHFGFRWVMICICYRNSNNLPSVCCSMQVHRMCMFLALILSISASVIIFVDSWAFTYNPNGPVAEQYHPILGVILTSLLILQVLIAFCRPGPNAKSRFLFNWFHWFVGNAVHIIAGWSLNFKSTVIIWHSGL